MPKVAANGIEIFYESHGDPARPCLLLVMGLGAQLVGWDDDFVQALVERGFRVVRFDNRDAGLSTHFDGVLIPHEDAKRGDFSKSPYTLEDMAKDAVGLLDALGVERAHVVGASMGGMIAQTLAITHPARVRTLCSIMSTTGASGVGQATPEATAVLFSRMPTGREAILERNLANQRVIGSKTYPAPEATVRRRQALAYDRAFYPEGFNRQVGAVQRSGDRTEKLKALAVPTLVLHGDEDPLIQISGGQATARAIPGAKLVELHGMGHDLPRELWPQVVDAIAENAARG